MREVRNSGTEQFTWHMPGPLFRYVSSDSRVKREARRGRNSLKSEVNSENAINMSDEFLNERAILKF